MWVFSWFWVIWPILAFQYDQDDFQLALRDRSNFNSRTFTVALVFNTPFIPDPNNPIELQRRNFNTAQARKYNEHVNYNNELIQRSVEFYISQLNTFQKWNFKIPTNIKFTRIEYQFKNYQGISDAREEFCSIIETMEISLIISALPYGKVFEKSYPTISQVCNRN